MTMHSPGDPWGDPVAGRERERGTIPPVSGYDSYVMEIEVGRRSLAEIRQQVEADDGLTANQKTALYGRISVYQSDAERLARAEATRAAADELR